MKNKIVILLILLCCICLFYGCSETKVTFVFDENKSVTVSSKNNMIDPLWIEKEGYYLEGWYTNKDCTNRFDFNKKLTKSITLYPHLLPVTYKVKIISNLELLSPNISEDTLDLYNFSFFVRHNESFNINKIVYIKYGYTLKELYRYNSYGLKEIKINNEVVFHNETEWSSDCVFTYSNDIELYFEYYDELSEVKATEKAYFDGILAQDSTLIKTESGLVYKVLTVGTGDKPLITNSVVINYKGFFMDGTLFDEGNEVTLPLTNLIEGFKESILLMNTGEKIKAYIPFSLGYGSRVNGNIPAYSTLIFEIELISIK